MYITSWYPDICIHNYFIGGCYVIMLYRVIQKKTNQNYLRWLTPKNDLFAFTFIHLLNFLKRFHLWHHKHKWFHYDIINMAAIATTCCPISLLCKSMSLPLFSPLDLRSNGLMVSCFVRRPPFTLYIRSPLVNFSVIWYRPSLGQYPEAFLSFFWLNHFRAPQGSPNVPRGLFLHLLPNFSKTVQ